MEEIKFENGSIIELRPSENVTRGKGVWATPIDCPEHIKIAAQTFDDRIEFRAYNMNTERGQIAPFYFKDGESPASMHIKQLHIVKNLIKKVE